jgi:hydroxyethylthiazole kinase-like uncharacterized protein yjeF
VTEILTSAQMRAVERAIIDSGTVTGLELMERAGQGVLDAIFDEWPDLADGAHRATVLCGPGNNGGDGFVVARLLAGRGWQVAIVLLGDPSRLTPDAQTNHDRWCAAGGAVIPWQDLVAAGGAAISDLRAGLFASDVVVDALFGTGLTRPLGEIHNTIWQLFDLDTGPIYRLVSIDVPSGLCADSGRLLGLEGFAEQTMRQGLPPFALTATLTVTFHSLKLGHLLALGPSCCGKVVVKDIGLPKRPRHSPEHVRLIAPPTSARIAKASGHKFSHGHALVLSGGAGRTGAARLAARGALRIGAGLVTLGVPGSAQMEVAAQITALMLRRIDDAATLTEALQDVRLNALCLGPGFGFGEVQSALIAAALDSKRPIVLDADALTALANRPELFAKLHDRSVLTPHDGEFARLFPDLAEKLTIEAISGPGFSKVDAVRAAAQRADCVILLKGPDTVVAAPNGQCRVNAAVYDRAAPWLATAGAGDVLTGFIAGLLARGEAPFAAACLAAWLHVECARSFGPGLIAEDLPEMLPKVFAALSA